MRDQGQQKTNRRADTGHVLIGVTRDIARSARYPPRTRTHTRTRTQTRTRTHTVARMFARFCFHVSLFALLVQLGVPSFLTPPESEAG